MNSKTPWYFNVDDHCEVFKYEDDAHSAVMEYIYDNFEDGEWVTYCRKSGK